MRPATALEIVQCLKGTKSVPNIQLKIHGRTKVLDPFPGMPDFYPLRQDLCVPQGWHRICDLLFLLEACGFLKAWLSICLALTLFLFNKIKLGDW